MPQGDTKEAAERYARRRAADKDALAPDPRISISGNRVMIVEDEALVAMVVTESLTTLGCSVVGPFSRCSDAMAAIEADKIDAAILDVNLDGEMVYPLADLLTERGVPFIFVTGYGAESIDDRFSHIPVIQKPVERHVLQRIFVVSTDEKPKPVRERVRDGNGSARASVG